MTKAKEATVATAETVEEIEQATRLRPRVRIVDLILQVHAVADDGETLEPLEVSPIRLTERSFKGFSLAGLVDELQGRAEQEQLF